jgi:hypothetical protein
MLRQIARSVAVEPAPRFRGQPDAAPKDEVILGTKQIWIGSGATLAKVYLVFEMYNGGTRPLEVTGVELVAPRLPVERAINRVQRVEIVSSALAPKNRVAVIPRRSRAKGAILLDSPGNLIPAMTLRINAVGLAAPITAQLEGYELIPIRKPPPPDPYVGRVAVALKGFLGGIWLTNPLDKEDSDATTLVGLGARATYYFNSIIGVEGDMAAGRAGEARFNDVDYNGVQGDIVRSAGFARVRFGALLRVGSGDITPTLRIGVGAQGASHTAELRDGGVFMDVPEVGFELDFLWYFGAGVDVELSESFTGGIGISGLGGICGDSRSLEAGVHLAYSWKP